MARASRLSRSRIRFLAGSHHRQRGHPRADLWAIFHIMRGMGMGEVLLVAVVGVAVVGCGWWLWNRHRRKDWS